MKRFTKALAYIMKNFPNESNNGHELVDLYILGTGIMGLSQITFESAVILEKCRIILDLSQTEKSLKKLNPKVVDLEPLYWTGEDRSLVYKRIVNRVMQEISRGPSVALVTYGHPYFADDVTIELSYLCKKNGMNCQILPAISCMDTLPICLRADFAEGAQIVLASHLLTKKLRLNPMLQTVILQLYELDSPNTADVIKNSKGRFIRLQKHLMKFYSPDQKVIIVYTKDGVSIKDKAVKTSISNIDANRRRIFPGTTLYIPATND